MGRWGSHAHWMGGARGAPSVRRCDVLSEMGPVRNIPHFATTFCNTSLEAHLQPCTLPSYAVSVAVQVQDAQCQWSRRSSRQQLVSTSGPAVQQGLLAPRPFVWGDSSAPSSETHSNSEHIQANMSSTPADTGATACHHTPKHNTQHEGTTQVVT